MNAKATILLGLFGGLVLISVIVLSAASRGEMREANGIVVTCMWAIPAGIYLLPSFIAALRDAPNFIFILIANLFAGWTGLGWLGCLIWAAVDQVRQAPVVIQHISYPTSARHTLPPPLPSRQHNDSMQRVPAIEVESQPVDWEQGAPSSGASGTGGQR